MLYVKQQSIAICDTTHPAIQAKYSDTCCLFSFTDNTVKSLPSRDSAITQFLQYRARTITIPSITLEAPLLKKINIPFVNKNKWILQVGTAVNVSTEGSQVLQPYPFFDAKYSLTPRLYIASGITMFSPIAIKGINGMERNYYVNDTLRNVRMYYEKEVFKSLYYVDVPIKAGWQLTKNISLEGGILFSPLIKSKSDDTLEPYDFNMNRVYLNTGNSLSRLSAVEPIIKNDAKIKKTDFRMLAGIEYNIYKKMSVNLQYHRSLKPIITGYNTPDKKNSLLTLKIKFGIN